MKILVLHGPNLNLIGTREPEIYGRATLADINRDLAAQAGASGAELECFQSNHEGALIDRIQAARGEFDALILNPGGLTHTSVSLRDAIIASELPCIEVHLSNIHAREEFRHHSYVSGVASGVICGLGAIGYECALKALLERLK